MANTKISALTSGVPALSTDLIPIDRAGSNYSISLANITNADNTLTNASVTISKGAHSDSSLDITCTDQDGWLIRLMSPTDFSTRSPSTYFDTGGDLYSRAGWVLSGVTTGAGDTYNVQPPSAAPGMLAIWADVGEALQVRTAPLTGAANYLNLNRGGYYTMSIEEDGHLQWGSSTSTHAAMDAAISRVSPNVLQIGMTTGTPDASGELNLSKLKLNSGSVSAPSYGFSSTAQEGLYDNGGYINFVVANYYAGYSLFNLNYLGANLPAGTRLAFTTTASADQNISGTDTGISRNAAATIAIGNSIAGDASGTLELKKIVLTDFGSTPTSSSGGGTGGTVGEIVQHSGVLYFCSATGAAGIATWNVITMTPSA